MDQKRIGPVGEFSLVNMSAVCPFQSDRKNIRHLLYVSFGQGSSLLWTHTLRPFYSRPIALTQEGRSHVDDVCVTEG